MAQAYLTLLNNGVFKPLRLTRDDGGVVEAHTRVYAETAVRQVMHMMRDVVEEKDGTGKRARVDGLLVAGKTGTAQKADHRSGTYGSKRLASFVGFFPGGQAALPYSGHGGRAQPQPVRRRSGCAGI